MKRMILLIVLCFFVVFVKAQERETKTVTLKNGQSLTGFVQLQQDGSYLVEMTTGDIFYFTKAEIESITSEKKDDSQPVTSSIANDVERLLVYKKGGKLRLKETGMPLEQSSFASYEGWDRYRGAQKMRSTGTVLMILGTMVEAGSLIIAGVLDSEYSDYWRNLNLDISYYEGRHDYWGFNVDLIYIFGCPVGGVALLSGVLLNVIGNTRLVKMEKGINNGTGYELTFGAQRNGIGLALNF